MKKTILGLFVLAILFLASCHSSPPPSPNLGGSWTFKGTTYYTTVDSCQGNTMYASNNTSSNISTFQTIAVIFYDTLLSIPTGTFTVVNGILPATPTQASIGLTTQGISFVNYESTGGNGLETITVTKSNGKYTITGNNIEMLNSVTPGSTDSSTLTFNITQTN